MAKNEEKPCSTCLKPIFRLIPGTQISNTKLKIHFLQDMVTAYEMQNKFLNKEVLELNQLRQHAIDREQKLFM